MEKSSGYISVEINYAVEGAEDALPALMSVADAVSELPAPEFGNLVKGLLRERGIGNLLLLNWWLASLRG